MVQGAGLINRITSPCINRKKPKLRAGSLGARCGGALGRVCSGGGVEVVALQRSD